jgi:hypothetical protein
MASVNRNSDVFSAVIPHDDGPDGFLCARPAAVKNYFSYFVFQLFFSFRYFTIPGWNLYPKLLAQSAPR